MYLVWVMHCQSTSMLVCCTSVMRSCPSTMPPSPACLWTQSLTQLHSPRRLFFICDLQCRLPCSHIHTHTHPLNGPLSGTTRVSRYQKGKTNLDFTETRDNEWQWHQLGHMQVCTSLQTDNHTVNPPLSCLQAGCPSCHLTSSVCVCACVRACVAYRSAFLRPNVCEQIY